MLKRIAIISSLLLFGIALQAQNLTGTWNLNTVELKKLTKNGSTQAVMYDKTSISNAASGIFETLRFEGSTCFLKVDEKQVVSAYEIQNSILSLTFAPVPYTYTIKQLDGNELSVGTTFVVNDKQFIPTVYTALCKYSKQ